MINRKIGPIPHMIKKLSIPDLETYSLQNGVKVCEVNLGSQEILKIEVVHFAGRIAEKTPLAARATAALLKEGCGLKSSAQVAEEIDLLGASIKTASNMDFSFTSILTLTKHFDKVIPLLHEFYEAPMFLEDELHKFKNQNIQKLKEEMTKNDVISYRQITEMIFGSSHPYGFNSTESDYLGIQRPHILQHFEDYYGSDHCYIFLSGFITDAIRKKINDLFGQKIKKSQPIIPPVCNEPIKKNQLVLTSKNEHQSSLKIGRRLFNRTHPDNAGFFMLNTIFGGYFGSRLMTSIREDKGLTYDIHSSMDQMLYDGCFYIAAEADPSSIQPLIDELYHQMEVLKQDLVRDAEMNMVKNYMMGNFMNMLDGPLNMASFAKNLALMGKTTHDFEKEVDEILNINADEIRSIAQKYFDEHTMIEVVVCPETVSKNQV